MDPNDPPKTFLEINPDTAITALWVTWTALGEALAEIGRMYPDDGWKPAMRDKMLHLFEHGTITEHETGQGVTHPALSAHLKNLEPESLRDGIRAVDAALDRIVYTTDD